MITLFTAATSEARAKYAYRTTESVLRNLRYSGELRFHISDDGSSKEHRDRLYAIAGGDERLASVTCTNSEGRGYGASFNAATMITHQWNGVILALEDDWELESVLDVDPLVAALGDEVRCVRLGYIGFTAELRGKFVNIAGQTLLLLSEDSESRDVFAGHPRLETVEFERAVGEWPLDQNPGATEFIVCGRREARIGVAWPIQRGAFGHIGAVQARSDQR